MAPYYVRKYGISNLWKFNMSRGARLVYTLLSENGLWVVVVLEMFLTHKEYEKRFGYCYALAAPDTVLEQFSQVRIAGKGPDDLALVEDYLVGALQIVENTVESLILELPRKTLPELLLCRIGFCPLNLPLNHEDSVQPGLMENRGRCHILSRLETSDRLYKYV